MQVEAPVVGEGVVVRHLVRVPGLGGAPVDTVQTEGEPENERAEQGRIGCGASDGDASQHLRRRRLRFHRWRQVKIELRP